VRGDEFFEEGKVIPPESTVHDKIDKTFRTKASGISHSGIIYADSDANVAKAMARLLKCRGTFEEELDYITNQKEFVEEHSSMFEAIQSIFTPYFNEWQGAEEECRQHYDDPHPKRDLRIQAYEELVAGNGRSYRDGTLFSRLWLRKVLYKMKKNEFAKFGKVPRMIGDLGVAASLQGFRVTDLLKRAMAAEDLHYGNMLTHFCKAPTTTELRAIFKNLISPPKGIKYYFVFFSDDSCLSIRNEDGSVKTYNLDISGCDASHTEAIFRALVQITPEIAQDDMQVLVDQCQLPIELIFRGGATNHEMRDKFDYHPNSLVLQPVDPLTGKDAPRLYSGSTITTIINNLACLMGAFKIMETQAETPAELSAAFKKAGYKMTIEECHDYSDIQFLKNSPAYDINGELQPLLNIGVLLRSSGTCKGDLPGKAKNNTFKERHDRYQGSLINGMYPNVSFPLIDNMRKTTLDPDEKSLQMVEQMLQYKHTFEGKATFTSEEVYRRYRLSELERMELDLDFATAGYAHYYSSTGASTILQRDYGLTCATGWHVPTRYREYI